MSWTSKHRVLLWSRMPRCLGFLLKWSYSETSLFLASILGNDEVLARTNTGQFEVTDGQNRVKIWHGALRQISADLIVWTYKLKSIVVKGIKRPFLPKMLLLLQITWYGHANLKHMNQLDTFHRFYGSRSQLKVIWGHRGQVIILALF